MIAIADSTFKSIKYDTFKRIKTYGYVCGFVHNLLQIRTRRFNIPLTLKLLNIWFSEYSHLWHVK